MTKIGMIAATTLVLAASTADAASPRYNNNWNHHGSISASERIAIARSKAHLAAVKRQAWRDGRVTAFERMRIRFAEARYNQVLYNALRS
jgi:hypothetical protein